MLANAQTLYYAWEINHRKSSSDESKFIGVLSEAKVDLNPHQVEAALFAFKSPLSKGAILADEVGLGKTIEAGIILSELWAEQKRHIIIIVPASLRNQWNLELEEKFYLPSIIMESGMYNEVKSKVNVPFDVEKIIICSYDFAASHADEISLMPWDLVVFDEAHKLRNVYKKDSIRANVLKDALRPFKKLLLTATPLQNNLKELYGLISIIDDEFFSSSKTFEERYNGITTRDLSRYGELKNRISHIVHRTLRSQVREYVNYTKRIPFMQEYRPTALEMELYHKMTNYLLREGTYGIQNEIRPLLSMLIWKIMSSSAYALSYTLSKIIERLETIKITGKAGSAIMGAIDDFEISSDNEIEPDVMENEDLTEFDIQQINDEIKELKGIKALAVSIGTESKAVELLKALDIAFAQTEKIGAEKKALIFTESCKTQDFLRKFLEENGYQDKIVCFNGTNSKADVNDIYKKWLIKHQGSSKVTGNTLIDKKQAIVDFFKTDAEIMIATEAGAEGINLQFCSLVVNYDMPWNPQRIEQRIGRCHRYGQKHDVVVVNFVNMANAADRRVYQLLNSKFNLFDGVFGSSDEVIGALDSTVNFERRLLHIYQKCRTEEEINAAFDALQADLEDLIKERIIQTKKSLIENFDKDVLDRLKFIQGSENSQVSEFINHFWKLACSVLYGQITDINESDKSFKLIESLSNDIPMGYYTLDKNAETKMLLRLAHPLGQYIVDKGMSMLVPDQTIKFDMSSYPYRMPIVENHIGENGYLIAFRVTSLNQYDQADSVIFCSITENGEVLPSEFGNKLLELNALSHSDFVFPEQMSSILKQDFEVELDKFKTELENKTAEFANYEIEKYESWSEDRLVPLQREVMDLRKEKDEIHRQFRRERDAKSKLLLKRKELEFDSKLRKKQQELFDLEDKYHLEVDLMTSNLLSAMQNQIDTSIMFRIGWSIV